MKKEDKHKYIVIEKKTRQAKNADAFDNWYLVDKYETLEDAFDSYIRNKYSKKIYKVVTVEIKELNNKGDL